MVMYLWNSFYFVEFYLKFLYKVKIKSQNLKLEFSRERNLVEKTLDFNFTFYV